jgi:hypothetical protein
VQKIKSYNNNNIFRHRNRNYCVQEQIPRATAGTAHHSSWYHVGFTTASCIYGVYFSVVVCTHRCMRRNRPVCSSCRYSVLMDVQNGRGQYIYTLDTAWCTCSFLSRTYGRVLIDVTYVRGLYTVNICSAASWQEAASASCHRRLHPDGAKQAGTQASSRARLACMWQRGNTCTVEPPHVRTERHRGQQYSTHVLMYRGGQPRPRHLISSDRCAAVRAYSCCCMQSSTVDYRVSCCRTAQTVGLFGFYLIQSCRDNSYIKKIR